MEPLNFDKKSFNDYIEFSIDGYTVQTIKSDELIVESSILPLFNRYRDVLTDDYWPQDEEESDNRFREIMDYCHPYFMMCYSPTGDLCGFIYFTDWRNGKHSCSFHLVIDERYQGPELIKVYRQIGAYFLYKFGCCRLEGCLPSYNKRGIAFAKLLGAKIEGLIKFGSFKNGKPLDYITYALTRNTDKYKQYLEMNDKEKLNG